MNNTNPTKLGHKSRHSDNNRRDNLIPGENTHGIKKVIYRQVYLRNYDIYIVCVGRRGRMPHSMSYTKKYHIKQNTGG